MLLARFVFFVPVTIVGLIVLFTRYGGFAVLRYDAEVEEPPVPAPPPPPQAPTQAAPRTRERSAQR